ncbi:MAG TPA: PrsW family glutamic-type intramembrane protease [Verrucomicrobiae bacterium]|nr:PrsW family glutamic-type intramembrane protease [Verrucomicrobiae bacterium]
MPFYYIDPNRGRVGPFSLEELYSLHRAGVIQMETEVFLIGAGDDTAMPFAVLWNMQQAAREENEAERSAQTAAAPSRPESERVKSFARRTGRDIREMLPHLMLPLDEFRRFSWIENRRIAAIAAVGLLPLIIYAFFREPSQVGNAFWAMALYFSSLWALFFFYVFPAPEVSVRVSALCFFTTSVVSVSVLLIVYDFWPLNALVSWIKSDHWFIRWVGFVLGVGLPEELCKALILVIILRRFGPFQPQTVLFYGLISGLGFGIYEGVKYQTQHNFEFARTAGQPDTLFAAEYYLLNLIRLTTLPFLHAIWTGMAGYFLGFAAQYPERRGGLLLVAIGLPAFLHGSYNAFSASLGLPIALLSVLALNLYLAKSTEFSHLLKERKPERSESANNT